MALRGLSMRALGERESFCDSGRVPVFTQTLGLHSDFLLSDSWVWDPEPCAVVHRPSSPGSRLRF